MSQPSRIAFLGALLALNGCATFNARAAVEVSRDDLLAMSHNTTADCLWYRGRDDTYHYIFHNQTFHKTSGSEGSYKIRIEDLPLKESFAVGEREYPLFSTMIRDATAVPAKDSDAKRTATADDADPRG